MTTTDPSAARPAPTTPTVDQRRRHSLRILAIAALVMALLTGCGTSPEARRSPPPAATTAPATASTCSFPSGPIEKITLAWRAVVVARGEDDRRRSALRYRRMLTDVRAQFVGLCPADEPVFDQVFVDAQFLVGYKALGPSHVDYDEFAAAGNLLLESLNLQDRLQFVAARCRDSPPTEPSCQALIAPQG